MGNEGPSKRHERHPSVESPELLAEARKICDTILETTSDDDIEDSLIETCRKMQIGQLAYALLNRDKATHDFPPRDHAVATAYKEKYDARIN